MRTRVGAPTLVGGVLVILIAIATVVVTWLLWMRADDREHARAERAAQSVNEALQNNVGQVLTSLRASAGLAKADGNALGMIPVDSPYKASVIFAQAFKRLVEDEFGWPVLVVIPCRDFIYVVADNSPLLGKMGSVVVKEFRNSGYPITTEVLRVSDEGIEAIGQFPHG